MPPEMAAFVFLGERWARGLCRHPAKVVPPEGGRGFESRSLRQKRELVAWPSGLWRTLGKRVRPGKTGCRRFRILPPPPVGDEAG